MKKARILRLLTAWPAPKEDVDNLKRCTVGKCELKLSEAALARIKKEVDWSKPTATADVLVPDPRRGPGFWFASVNRCRSDGLDGFTGSIIRGKVRGEAEKGMQAALRATKAKLEQPRSTRTGE